MKGLVVEMNGRTQRASGSLRFLRNGVRTFYSEMNAKLKRSLMMLMFIVLPLQVSLAEVPSFIAYQHQRMAIEYPESFDDDERRVAYQWLQQVSAALQTVHGDMPQDEFRVVLRESSRYRSTVPWGQVKRGEPDTVLLVINPGAGVKNLLSDWTAFHELSHLMLPYRGYGDIWLSEGLATYYQNIVQARAGLFDEQTMWQRLVAGFKRGERDRRWQHATLELVSDNLRETRQYMRVHWSGVLYWLHMDIALREQGSSLDLALKKLKTCCQGQQLSAWQIVHTLDRLYQTQQFSRQFEAFRSSLALPDYHDTLNALGVVADHESLIFNDHAPNAVIRKALSQSAQSP